MGFDETDIAGLDARIGAGIAHQLGLGFSAWQGNSVGVAVLVQRGTEDHALNRISIGDRFGERLEQDNPGTLTPDKAICLSGKGLALAIRRKHPRLRKSDESIRRDDDRHSARHRHFTTPGTQRLASEVHGGQRGRASGIHRETRAAEIEAVRNPVGCDTVGTSGRRVGADALAIRAAALDILVIIMGNSHENTDIGAFFQINYQSSILHCFPRGLEEKPLLRVDIRSFTRRNSKELGIELVDLIEKSPAPSDGFAGQARLRIAEALNIETVGWNLRHGVATFGEKLPKRFGVIDPAWEPAADSDDCDTFLWHKI